MLTKFCVRNLKTFPGQLVFDLGNPGNYEFNQEAIQPIENVVSKAIVYGFNGCGKSNLGLALFDIIMHLSDTEKGDLSKYNPYLNLNNHKDKAAFFEYHFRFGDSNVIYSYKKSNLNQLLEETLVINNKKVLWYDFQKHSGYVKLKGAESLNVTVEDSLISRVKYVSRNTILEKNKDNDAFKSFVHFVDHMLMFYCLIDRGYRGFQLGTNSIPAAIIEAGKLKEFEAFLRQNHVDLKLEEGTQNGQKVIMVRFGDVQVEFFSIVSTGTISLALFFYWYILLENASFVFMDEFDAFYHYELAEDIVSKLKSLRNTQIVFTTHNTDLLSNDLLRPDCYYWLNDGSIESLNHLTEKELRKAHNLQKMFKAGAFNE